MGNAIGIKLVVKQGEEDGTHKRIADGGNWKMRWKSSGRTLPEQVMKFIGESRDEKRPERKENFKRVERKIEEGNNNK